MKETLNIENEDELQKCVILKWHGQLN